MDSFFSSQFSNDFHLRKSYQYTDIAVRLMLFYKDEVSLDGLHDQLGIGRRYLQEVFKYHVGLSPKQLFRMIRFQKSFQYLNKNIPLTEIAQRCGYHDHALHP